jgi:membrane protease YdiL (CAAX protease family)
VASEPSGPPEIDPVPPVYGPGPQPRGRVRPPLVRLALAFYGVLLGLAFAWAALDGRSLAWAPSALGGDSGALLRSFGAGLLAAAIVVLLSHQLTQRTRLGEQLARALAAALGPLSLAECWLLALVSGIAEEAFFRGALQPQVGLVAASLLFGAAHFVPRRVLLLWSFFAIAVGFLLGWLFDATGSLIAPVVAHAGINGVNLRQLTRRRES